MKAEDPFFTLDWFFADMSKENGRALCIHALEDKKRETSLLIKLVEADSMMHFSLWSELLENHPVGALWLEFQTDLLATIHLENNNITEPTHYSISYLQMYFTPSGILKPKAFIRILNFYSIFNP